MVRADVGGRGRKQMEASKRVAVPKSNHFWAIREDDMCD